MSRKTDIHTRGLRLGNFAQICTVIDEEIEAVWSLKKTPKEALDAAVERGDALLRQFERLHRHRPGA
jgi:sn-glycerol 3-phosphate transport system substrate-binding protein